MNQKNIFTVIAALLLLRGISFYFMGDQIIADVYPNLDEMGKNATATFMQVVAMLFVIIALITYAARNSSQILWAYAIGFSLFSLNTLKHVFIDHINVPILAIVLQVGVALVSIYLWLQNRNSQA